MSLSEQPPVKWYPNNPPYIEGKDVPPLKAKPYFRALVDAARISFAGTAITEGGIIGERETKTFRRFLDAATIIDPEIFNSSTQEHIQLTAQMAVMTAKRINQSGNLAEPLNLYEVEVAALAHDVGRTDSHHRGHTDLVGKQLLTLAGATKDFLQLLPDDDRWMPVEKLVQDGNQARLEVDEAATVQKITDLNTTIEHPTRAVVEVVDSIAKFNAQGKIRRWSEVFEEIKDMQTLDSLNAWPSEYKRQNNVLNHLEEARIYYESLIAWVEKQTDCSIEEIIEGCEKGLVDNPVKTFADMEKVLPLNFKTAVFDVGGVLIFGPASQNNDQLIADICLKLNIVDEKTKQRLIDSFDKGVVLMQAGQASSNQVEEDLVKEFGKKGDKIGLHELLLAGEYGVDPVIVNAIKYLQKRGIRIVLASNTTEDTWEDLVLPHLERAGLDVQNVAPVTDITNAQNKVAAIEAAGRVPAFASFDLGTRKGGGVTVRSDNLGFFPIISKILASDPNETISIDDKSINSREAEKARYKTGYDYHSASAFILDLPKI